MNKIIIGLLSSFFTVTLVYGQIIINTQRYGENNIVEQTLERARQQREEFRQNDEEAAEASNRSEKEKAQSLRDDANVVKKTLLAMDKNGTGTPNRINTLKHCGEVFAAAQNPYSSDDKDTFNCHIAVNAIWNSVKVTRSVGYGKKSQ